MDRRGGMVEGGEGRRDRGMEDRLKEGGREGGKGERKGGTDRRGGMVEGGEGRRDGGRTEGRKEGGRKGRDRQTRRDGGRG